MCQKQLQVLSVQIAVFKMLGGMLQQQDHSDVVKGLFIILPVSVLDFASTLCP